MINKNELIKEMKSLNITLNDLKNDPDIDYNPSLLKEYELIEARLDALAWVLYSDEEVEEEPDNEKIKVIIEMQEILYRNNKIELEITKEEYDDFMDDEGKIDKIMEKSIANKESTENFMLALDRAGFKVLSFCEGDIKQKSLDYYDTYEEEDEHDET